MRFGQVNIKGGRVSLSKNSLFLRSLKCREYDKTKRLIIMNPNLEKSKEK